MAASNKTKRLWTAAELEVLEDMLGNMPFPLLVQQWNRWATSQGIPRRSVRSLAYRANRMGSRLTFGRWVGVGDVARALGRWPSTIWDWSKRGLVRRYDAGHASAILREDIKRLARKQPELFGGATREGLMQLLEDEKLVDSIRERYPRPAPGYGGTRRVLWVERGVVFPSIKAAAMAVHVTESAIRAGLLKGRPVVGHRFEAID